MISTKRVLMNAHHSIHVNVDADSDVSEEFKARWAKARRIQDFNWFKNRAFDQSTEMEPDFSIPDDFDHDSNLINESDLPWAKHDSVKTLTEGKNNFSQSSLMEVTIDLGWNLTDESDNRNQSSAMECPLLDSQQLVKVICIKRLSCSSFIFESKSRLPRTEKWAFRGTGSTFAHLTWFWDVNSVFTFPVRQEQLDSRASNMQLSWEIDWEETIDQR